MTCHDARELFSARADDALGATEEAELQAHLETCGECQREWVRFEQTVALLRGIEPAHAPAGFVDRVVAARPRPWYARLARGVFVPWPVKLPLEAAAIVLVAGLAIMVFQRSPGLQYASHVNEAPGPVALPPESAKEEASRLPMMAPTPLSKTQRSLRQEDVAASKARSTPQPREDARDTARTTEFREQLQGRAESRRDLPQTVPAEREKNMDALSAEARQEGPTANELLTGKTAAGAPSGPPSTPGTAQSAPAPAGQPSLLAAEKGVAKQATPERRAAVQGFSPSNTGLQADLAAKDRAAVEATVRDLVTREGGRVVPRPDIPPGMGLGQQPAGSSAPVLLLIVPADRWDEVRRGLEALGTLHVTGQKVEEAGRLLITLRLER